jgi:hypothetical protein
MPFRFSVRTLLIVMTLIAVVLGARAVLKPFLTFDAEERVYNSINVGDTEQKLITTLKSYGIRYDAEVANGQTIYNHSDGFLGIYFYYVANGRVTMLAMD